jgi:hypothetical protein
MGRDLVAVEGVIGTSSVRTLERWVIRRDAQNALTLSGAKHQIKLPATISLRT